MAMLFGLLFVLLLAIVMSTMHSPPSEQYSDEAKITIFKENVEVKKAA